MGFRRSIFVTMLILFSVSTMANQERNELVVILDTSGSMGESLSRSETVFKIDYAKRELNKILKDFSNEDKFDLRLIHFAGSPVVTDFKNLNTRKYTTEVAPFVENRIASGGTPLAQSVDLATDIFLSSNKPNKTVLILSDGQDDNGVSSLLRSMTNLNTKTNGSVMVQFFAIGVDKRTWTEFNEISKVINFGTLYLVESTGQGGDFFDLTADAISGSWTSSQIRENVGRRLGAAHAQHVHVISSLDRASTRDSSKRLKTINWTALQSEDPELYSKLKEWFENLEDEYTQIKVQELVTYLLNEVIRPKLSLEETRVSNFQVYKAKMAEVWADYLVNIKRASQSRERERIRKNLKEQEFNGIMDYVSYGFNFLSLTSTYGSEGSLKGIFTSSYPSASVDLLVAYIVDELTDDFRFHDSVEISTRISSAFGAIAALSLFDKATIKEFKSLNGITPKHAVSSVLLLGSSASGNIGIGPDSSALSAPAALDLKRNEIEKIAVDRQKQEYAAYQKFVEREEAVEVLRAILPELQKADIVARVERASRVADPLERALILFDGKPEYLEKIALAQVLTEEVEKRASLSKSLGQLAKEQVVASGLRGNDELPDYVQAYFNNLKSDINNSEFNERVDLFLLGIE